MRPTLIAIGALFSAVAIQAAPSSAVAAPLAAEEEELFLEVRLGHERVSEQLVAYRRDGRVLLPVGELCRLLGIGLKVAPAEGRVRGFILDEARTFMLDAAAGSVRLADRRESVEAAGLKLASDDVYVDAALLSRWMPLDFEADLFALRLRIESREPLPMQMRLARQRRYERLKAQLPGAPLPRFEDRYRLWSLPAIDPSVTFAMRRSPDGQVAPEGQFSTYATGDALFMSSAMFVAGNEQRPISDFRLTLTRKDPAGRLFGDLGASDLTFGSVHVPGMPLVSMPRAGSGVMIGNYPLDQQSQFDSHNFRGDLPPGWDVELYQNDQLVAYQTARDDGLYDFAAVPLRPGMNEFRLVFYGPHGQQREELRRFNVGASLVPSGEQRYRAALALQEDGRPRMQWQQDYGVHRHLTAGWGLATVPVGLGSETYGLAGLKGYWGPVFAHADLALARAGGLGAQLGLQARLGPLDVSARHARLQDMESELLAGGTSPLAHRTQLRLESIMALPGLNRLSVGAQAQHDEEVTGGGRERLSVPVVWRHRQFSVAHQLAWEVAPERPLTGPFSDGMIQAAWRLAPFSLRGELRYQPQGPSAAALGVSGMLWQDHHLQLSASYTPATDDWRYRFNLSRNLGALTLGTTARHGDTTATTLSTTLSAGLDHDPAQARWYPHGVPVAASGAASVKVFVDENLNGSWDPGEPPIEGVEVQALGKQEVRTDAAGVAHLSGLPSHRQADLTLAVDTLADPLWQPARPGVSWVPRPGRTAVLELPVITTGELSGTITLRRKRKALPLSGAALELVDAEGRVRHRVKTAYDGFYAVSAVVPGRYTLRVAPAQAAAIGIAGSAAIEVAVPATGGFIDGLDMALEVGP